MADPIFVDTPAPPKASGPVFVDAPAPSGNPAPVPGQSGIPVGGPNVPMGPRFGMNDDQILKASGYTDAQVKKIKSASSYKAGQFSDAMTDPNSFSAKLRQDPAVAPSMVVANAVGTPVSAAFEGANHLLGAMGLRDDADVMLSDAQRRVREMNFKQNVLPGAYYNAQGQTPLATKALDLGGQAVPLLVGGTEGKAAEVAPGLGKTILRGIGTGAKYGAASGALQPVDNPDANYFATKGKQVGLGAAGGAIFGGVSAPAAPLIGKLLNYKGTAATPLEAAQNVAAKFNSDMNAAGFSSIDAVRAAAAKGNPQAKSALLTMEAISPNPDAVLQADAIAKMTGNKAQANKLYQAVSNEAGSTPLPAAETQTALEAAKGKLASSGVPNPQMENFIASMQKRLAEGGNADTSYSGLQDMRSNLGGMIRGMRSGNNALVATGQEPAILQGIKDAVTSDMQTGAASVSPKVAQLQNQADTFYKGNVVPYKTSIAKALDPDQTTSDTMFGKLFGPRVSPMQAQNNYNLLDPKGQAAVRSLIVNRAIENASGKTATGELTSEFDPGKFVQSLKSTSNTSGIAFKGADKWQLDGLSNVMEHLATVNKKTAFLGSPRMMMISGAGAAYGAAKGGGAEALAAFTPELARAAIMSPQGQRFLMSASDLKPGSPAMTALIQKFVGQLPKAGGIAAGPLASQVQPQTTPQVPQ